MEAGGQGSAENHRGGGGQLPRDPGSSAHTEGPQGLSCALDPGKIENKLWDFCLIC